MKVSKAFLLCSIAFSTLYGEVKHEELLSKTKKEILNYSYKQVIEDSDQLKKDWINPFSYTYSYNNGESYTTERSTIAISQPIFRSGGIYYAIKYADSFGEFSKTSIDVEKKELIKQTISTLFQIKKIGYSIDIQKLLVKNADIDVIRQKEQVLSGIVDISFLDNAILEANTRKNNLIDLEYEKELLLHTLSTLSDKKYTEVELPVLSLVDKERFFNNNIYLKQLRQESQNAYWLKSITTASYLPSLNFNTDYSRYHDTGSNPALSTDGESNIGLSITIPFDTRFHNDIQSSKIEYLQKKASIKDLEKEEEALFQNSLSKLKSIDKKIEIAIQDVALYNSLLTQLEEQLSVGMATSLDVETMKNSKKIKKVELLSLEVDKQLELLETYSRLDHE